MLINCVAYQSGEKLADIPYTDISEYVQQPGCFVWVALRDPSAEELEEMRKEFGLHELALEDVSHGHQLPKIEEYGDTLFVVLHLLEMDATGKIIVGEVGVFVGPNYVLSVRSHSGINFLNVRERCEREPHLLKSGAGFVLYALMDAVIDRYIPIIHALEGELEQIEAKIFSGSAATRASIEEMYGLKRKLMLVQHSVTPLLEAVSRLYGGRVPQVCLDLQEYYRDIFDHLERISRTIDGLRDILSTALQVNLSMISLSESAVTKELAAWAALFAVPTMIAGIYGMNFEHMPELKWSLGYPLTLLLMAALDYALWWHFRRAGWL
ncbi:magnesium/cobalt transporter CorA [Chitinimonas sp. BJB300]|uniref:magnesium/cobalt transporter CorA n=1 Tax=Chitinimonas sp. BJB300 TaxID=1559339 RepID=UPI000C10B99E|nr:magnesium/cobalt transporter CorA [Chitinimonas sp. BJB300]PHV11704.1 magnesium and cobalt transport protein CorA [Chitinimonas sp. BJB300]TSJ88580.1 magnesium/cobalt transporter CorA [Chitinimonas sp. BJB300]